MSTQSNAIPVGILGASGYTGAELVRLLAHHPGVEIRAITADRKAGQEMVNVFPHLHNVTVPQLGSIEDTDLGGLDTVFMGLPHGLTQEVVAGLPKHLSIVDLSADFRLEDVATYKEWYGHDHKAPDLQKEAVYGLTEHARDAVRKARLVANPGCYPTAAMLPLIPLLKAKAIATEDIVIDAKTGITGAGRAEREANLFAEVSEGIHPYAVANHRHAPEIEQELSKAAGTDIMVAFTPHLMPMNRGILATIYVSLDGATAADARKVLEDAYAEEHFVRVVPEGVVPATRHVRGSNHCLIGVFPDRRKGKLILVSVIDNLVKGAAGQAIQNFNLRAGLDETTALHQEPLFP